VLHRTRNNGPVNHDKVLYVNGPGHVAHMLSNGINYSANNGHGCYVK